MKVNGANPLEDFHRLQSGEIKAFERLFVSLYPGLCHIAEHYLQDRALSKDMAQEAFIKWWNKREDFTCLAAMKSFLYLTVKNLCLNYLRDHQHEVEWSDSLSEESDEDFELFVIEEEAVRALYDAVNRLPRQSANIMRLVLQGAKNQEISEKLGISVNSVKTLKYNAIDTLRNELRNTAFSLLLLDLFI